MRRIGFIGYGYLAKQVWAQGIWAPDSWAATGHRPTEQVAPDWAPFDWAAPSTWEQLPTHADRLLLCIPPLQATPEREKNRLQQWGRWMNQNRPKLTSLVYISSTSVYPNEPGLFDENSRAEPQNIKGQLRLCSEQVLNQFFDLTVLRPGAIYGPGRGTLARLRAGLPIPSDSGMIHRIHVEDLAQLCQLAFNEPSFPKRINGVDLHPCSSMEVARWLVSQKEFSDLCIIEDKAYKARTGAPTVKGRHIQNTGLIQWGYRFKFPDFQAGFTQGNLDEPTC